MERRALSRADAPWLWPYRALLARLGANPWDETSLAWYRRCNLDARTRGLSLSFALSSDVNSALAYERRIVEDGVVSCRDTLHDAVNALVWLRFPRTKRRISALHLAHAQAPPGRRGARRDALTLFDEHGAVLLSRDECWPQALRRHDWRRLWQQDPQGFTTANRVILFGHGLLARMPHPHVELTAKTLSIVCKEGFPSGEELDAQWAAHLETVSAPGMLLPMPVLGVPGWWPGQDEAFYANARAFRPARS